MFCTLKRSKEAGMAYSAKETDPPFAKPKGHYVVACTNCRKSKVKCSGEPLRCRRCAGKKLQCAYLGVGGQSAPSPTQDQPLQSEQDTGCDASTNELFAGSSDASGTTPAFRSSSPLTSAAAESLSLQNYSETFLSTSSDVSLPRGSQLSQTGIVAGDADFGNFLNDDMCQLTDYEGVTQLGHQPEHCFLQALKAFEATQVNLVWASDSRSAGAVELLSHLKQAVKDGEALLDCYVCMQNSAYIMMLISMCGHMAAVLQAVSAGSEARQRDAALGAKARQPKSHSDYDYNWRMRKQSLDEDDEHIILTSLRSSRAAKVKELVIRVETLVMAQSWPAHRDMIKDIRDKLHSQVE
ncbi:transcription factor [Cordyceps fumosorosea ARSEF 2679]|uniref:Transcription factor n=1 Tax=Cordyceps fumosorosea (strain ARSEF 2679) TaxID=1081104 RepID=A0A167CP91_CORFA|nr:transcription factor [Cordyceps fumosorosea ARSEF 2679]OAA41415.1 transcription factor [Cordyceps fumosorosea ARSEF 2679]